MNGGRVRFPRPVRHLTSVPSGRDVWLAARRSGLGGSDIAAIIGASPWRSPVDVWLDKTGRTSGDDRISERMRWGSLLEDTVAKEWAAGCGAKLRRVGLVADPDRPWRLASVDRAIITPGTLTAEAVLEVKTTAERAGGTDDDTLTARYAPQVQWYLGVTGLDVAHLAVLVGGQQLHRIRVMFDPDMWLALTGAADRWWADHVVAGVCPPAVPGDSTVLNRWPADRGTTVVADPDLVDLLWLRAAVKADADELAAQVELLDAGLKRALGPADELHAADGTVLATWREQQTRRIDTAALKQAGLYDQYTRRSTSRVLRIKQIGEDS